MRTHDSQTQGHVPDPDKLSADRPIVSSTGDLLDRAPFAHSIAQSILGWRGRDSLVVAILGPWGSGKSSVKNLIVEILNSDKDAPSILEFNPWSRPTNGQVSQSFFRELAISIGRIDSSRKSQDRANRLRLYGAYLTTGGYVATGLAKGLPYLMALAAALGIGGIVTESAMAQAIVKNTLLALAVMVPAAYWIEGLLKRLAGLANEKARSNEKTLADLKSDIMSDLKGMPRSVLVIMDDVDRLDQSSMREVMQLVRQNADFPNIVYLLLFQRDIVESALSEPGRTGREYLEKIVQAPFDLPQTPHDRIESVFFKGLDSILGSDPALIQRFDEVRWGNLYHGVIRSKFRNLRDVYRTLATLDFYASMLRGERAFEVNPVDLIGIEVVRVFEPELHKAIHRGQKLLTAFHDSRHRRDDAVKRELQGIVDKASAEFRGSAERLIRQLFPNVEWAFGGSTYGTGFADAWFLDLRICAKEIFPKYFQLSVPTGDISQSELEELIDLTASRKDFVARMRALCEEGRMRSAFGQLDSYKQKIPIGNAREFIPALLDVGEFADHKSIGRFGFTSHDHITRIAYWYLRQDSDPHSRSAILEQAGDSSDAMSVIEALLHTEHQAKERDEEPAELLLEDSVRERMKTKFVRRIAGQALEDPVTLLETEHLAGYLFRWRDWGDSDSAMAWVSDCLCSRERAVKLFRAFTGEVSSHRIGDHVSTTSKRFDLAALEKFVDREDIDRCIGSMSRQALAEDDNEVLQAVSRALSGED